MFAILIVINNGGCKREENLLDKNLSQISKDDEKNLDNFFGYLVTRTTFGYTICGEKPISIECLPCSLNNQEFPLIHLSLNSYRDLLLKQGWKTVKKYQSLLENDLFVLREVKKRNILVIINKKNCLRTIADNLNLFHSILKSDLTAQGYLDQVCHPFEGEDILDKSEILLGVLLGYGRNNAIAYDYREKLAQQLYKQYALPPPFASVIWKKITKKDRSFICNTRFFSQEIESPLAPEKAYEKWVDIKGKLFPFSSENYEYDSILNFTTPMGFMVLKVDENEKEIDNLKLMYKKSKKNLINTFRQRQFLRTTLKMINSLD